MYGEKSFVANGAHIHGVRTMTLVNMLPYMAAAISCTFAFSALALCWLLETAFCFHKLSSGVFFPVSLLKESSLQISYF